MNTTTTLRAYNYEDMQPGTIVPHTMDSDGWFEFRNDDSTTTWLNAGNLRTLDLAAQKGWLR